MFGTKVLEERESKFNGHLRVVKSLGLGTYIQANGLTQSGGVVVSMWRQTLKRIGYRKKKIVNCLILGYGGGTVSQILLQNQPDIKITGVDIDKDIVDLGKKYLKSSNNVKIVIGDVLTYVKNYSLSTKRYDLIIVDLYNGDQFPKKFETIGFLRMIRPRLAEAGIVIFNRLYFKDKKIEAEKFGNKLKVVFKNVEYYKPITNLMFICS